MGLNLMMPTAAGRTGIFYELAVDQGLKEAQHNLVCLFDSVVVCQGMKWRD
jgi:hypothetical protein